MDVDRLVRRHRDRPRDHGLVHVARTYGVPGRGDRHEVLLDLDAGRDRVRRRGRRGGSVAPNRSTSAPSIVVIQRRPSGPLPTTTWGTTSSVGAPGRNGNAPSAIGPFVFPTRSSWSMAARNSTASSAATRAATPRPGEPDTVAHEEVPVAARDVVQVEVGVERQRDGAHQSRVPSNCCVSPPDSGWCDASANPAVRSIATISSGSGRYATLFGRYR